MNNTLHDVIYPDLEPGVINYEMLDKSLKDGGYKGEAKRLQQLEELDYEKITTLRLEFEHILRIDHLWVLPNLTKLSLNFNKIEKIENIEMLVHLKELDLSFNNIEKIENLDTLVELEVLSLFNNEIKVIENLDALENLIILSLGNNKIKTLDGLERLRFSSKLSVLNFEGNPVSKDKQEFRLLIAAFLPNLKYYEYSVIKDEEKEKGKEKYARELREIEANQQEECAIRAKRNQELEDEQRLSSSFVEHLNGYQLFDSLFDGDADGRAVRKIGEEAEELIREYRKDFHAITQEIYKLGLKTYEERENEVETFQKSIKSGLEKAQKEGQKIIEEFMEFKDQIMKDIKAFFVEVQKTYQSDDEDDDTEEQTNELDNINNRFDDKMNEIWQQLMEEEMELFESIDEAIENFGRTITDMMNSFLEHVQIYFVTLRDVANNFAEQMGDAASKYIMYKLASRFFYDVPEELKDCLEDKDAIMNLVAGMRDFQIQKIDAREDKLLNRGKEWVHDLVEGIKNEQIERNRAKITEINFFLDQMKESVLEYEDELNDEYMSQDKPLD